MLVCVRAQSAELFESNLSVRALGMGNAYISVVDDAYALFYNPARLAFVEGFNIRVADPYILTSDPLELQSVVDSNSSSESLAETLEPFFDSNASGGLGARVAFTMPRFGFSFYGDAQLGVNLNNPVLPDLNLRAVADYGGVIGFAVPIVPMLTAGMNIKKVFRQGGDLTIDSTSIAELDLDEITGEIERKGTAFGLDLGLTMSVPGPIDASLSFMWKNVGGLSFTHDAGPGPPPDEDAEMIVGAAVGVDLPLMGLTGAIDFKHLDKSGLQLGQRVNLGVELNFLNMDFRAGLHQGYYTLGFGFSLGLIMLDLASYGVELGEFPGQREDRRYALQLTIELGLNPFFSLGDGGSGSGKSGKKRWRRRTGIKQRR